MPAAGQEPLWCKSIPTNFLVLLQSSSSFASFLEVTQILMETGDFVAHMKSFNAFVISSSTRICSSL